MRSVIIFWLCLHFVQLSAQRIPGQSYFSKNKYIEYIAGDIPIILVSPHGGELSPDSLPTIHSRGNDRGSRETTLSLMDSINAQTGGCKPHVVINHVHTSKLNMARSKDSAGTNAAALEAWDAFHSFIDEAKVKVSQTWQKGHYFEMHGNGRAAKWNEIGLGVSKEYLNHSDSAILTRLSKSTIKNMADSSNFIELVRGSTSLGGLLQAKGWKSTPSLVHPAPGANFFYAGWNTWKHGSRYSGTIDATHIENYYAFMEIANRANYSSDLAASILTFMKIHYGFNLNCVQNRKFELKTSIPVIYPNPAIVGEGLKLLSPQTISSYAVINSMGQALSKSNKSSELILQEAQAGIYIIKIVYNNGTIQYQKVILN